MTDEGTYIVISTKPVLKVRWLGLNIEPNGIGLNNRFNVVLARVRWRSEQLI